MNDLMRAVSNPTEIWMVILTLLFSALCIVLWSMYQAAKKDTEQRWANNDNVIKEMRAEMKEIANTAYTAKANSTLSEERRKNVEEKIDALMATNHQLVARIDALILEIAQVKTVVAVNEAKQQNNGSARRRSTNS
jgi:septal ring factor EnvC (AmiA/AmiB activator)